MAFIAGFAFEAIGAIWVQEIARRRAARAAAAAMGAQFAAICGFHQSFAAPLLCAAYLVGVLLGTFVTVRWG